MNSSISSSDGGGDPRAQRRIFGRILLTILAGMGIALALVRAFAWANDATSDSFLGRVNEARAALPRIVDTPGDLAMVFGSSMVEAGFSPRQFDAEMAALGAPVTSFNFGFGGLNPKFQEILSRRIVEAFEARDRRLRLAVIEFNPFQATTTRRDGARDLEDSFVGLLGRPSELFDIFVQDPTRGVRLFTIRYLRDGLSAEMITNHYGESFQPEPAGSELPVDETQAARRAELGEELGRRFDAEYPDWDGAQWSWSWQGGGTIPEERPAETVALVNEWYALALTPRRMENDRLWRVRSADILELRFDDELIDAFIGIVENLKTIADHVEIVLLPKNHAWIQNPPEALERQRVALERIARSTGVPVRNWQHLDSVRPEHFADTTHLARYTGAVAFTRHMARHYAPLLRR